ncbi:MAG: hypothetical protein IKB98_04085 [Clostridia bacterium]|nr:hypothetical protein [Clostridia bacterium]
MSRFFYYNRNPDGNEITDCVCRAISAATGLSYRATYRLLGMAADRYGCDKLCACCYSHLLTGWLGYKKYYCKNGEIVNDIVEKHKDSKIIIRIDRHLTFALYGVLADIWDCGEREVDCYWIVD